MNDATAFVLYSAGLIIPSIVIGYCLGGTIERRLRAEGIRSPALLARIEAARREREQ